MVRSYESTIKQHFEETYGPAKSHQEARDPPSGDSMGLDSWFLIVYDGFLKLKKTTTIMDGKKMMAYQGKSQQNGWIPPNKTSKHHIFHTTTTLRGSDLSEARLSRSRSSSALAAAHAAGAAALLLSEPGNPGGSEGQRRRDEGNWGKTMGKMGKPGGKQEKLEKVWKSAR